jgi:hypothetical protein
MASISYVSLHLSVSCQVTAKFGTHTSSSSILFILYLVIQGPQKTKSKPNLSYITAFKIFPVLILISAGSKHTSNTEGRDLAGSPFEISRRTYFKESYI